MKIISNNINKVDNNIKYLNKFIPIYEYDKKIQFQKDSLKYYYKIRNYISSRMGLYKFPVFDEVEIETINRCNNICNFCPANRNNNKRVYKKMTDEMFYSIINQLHDIKYSGLISLYSNNEPLLDNRIEEFYEHVRRELPDAYLQISTNGILLTIEKFERLANVVNKMFINNYNKNLIKHVSDIYEHFHDKYDNVEIVMRDIDEILYSRIGNSPNRQNPSNMFNYCSCILPYRQIVIRPDGKLSLCCGDVLGQTTMGDLNTQSILEIWNGNKYKEIRTNLKGGRSHNDLCKRCDAIYSPDCI